jgi:hypothetical protein
VAKAPYVPELFRVKELQALHTLAHSKINKQMYEVIEFGYLFF